MEPPEAVELSEESDKELKVSSDDPNRIEHPWEKFCGVDVGIYHLWALQRGASVDWTGSGMSDQIGIWGIWRLGRPVELFITAHVMPFLSSFYDVPGLYCPAGVGVMLP